MCSTYQKNKAVKIIPVHRFRFVLRRGVPQLHQVIVLPGCVRIKLWCRQYAVHRQRSWFRPGSSSKQPCRTNSFRYFIFRFCVNQKTDIRFMNSCKRAEPAFPVLAVSRPFLCDVHLHFNTDMSIAIRYPGFLTGKKTERGALPERCFLSFTNRRFLVGYSELFFIRYLYNLRHNHFQHILKSVKVVHLDFAVLSLMAA